MMLKQENGYGCGLYAVANALNYPNFVTDERIELSKTGNNVAQLTRWLYEDGYDIFIFTERIDGRYVEMPKFSWSLREEDSHIPFLVNLYATQENNHLIALRGYADQSIDIIDSCENDMVRVSGIDNISQMYPKILSVYSFRDSMLNSITILKK